MCNPTSKYSMQRIFSGPHYRGQLFDGIRINLQIGGENCEGESNIEKHRVYLCRYSKPDWKVARLWPHRDLWNEYRSYWAYSMSIYNESYNQYLMIPVEKQCCSTYVYVHTLQLHGGSATDPFYTDGYVIYAQEFVISAQSSSDAKQNGCDSDGDDALWWWWQRHHVLRHQHTHTHTHAKHTQSPGTLRAAAHCIHTDTHGHKQRTGVGMFEALPNSMSMWSDYVLRSCKPSNQIQSSSGTGYAFIIHRTSTVKQMNTARKYRARSDLLHCIYCSTTTANVRIAIQKTERISEAERNQWPPPAQRLYLLWYRII